MPVLWSLAQKDPPSQGGGLHKMLLTIVSAGRLGFRLGRLVLIALNFAGHRRNLAALEAHD
ncbi:MAG: hypothetical protein UC328_07875, partial [Adlercreutzia sp.]|nr:hypothetical protein [Adlercreutzia sp.]